MTKRLYVDPANSYAILNGAVLQGLGQDKILGPWPKGRSYHDIATFRAPYVNQVFNPTNQLLGLGALPTTIAGAIDEAAPPNTKRFLLSGEPVPKLSNNVSLPLNQVPRIGYGILALAAAGLSYFSYKRFKKAKQSGV